MSQGWFTHSPKELFNKVNDLNNDRQVWATEQLQKAHGNSQRYSFVYQTSKRDVNDEVDRERNLADDEATLALQVADISLRAWSSDRQSSKKGRASQAFQESMVVFANFLENFSGIVEIVRAADDQYGGLAYGTLSVFLGVFVRKTQREERLIEGFEELSYAFPRLQTLRSLGRSHESRTSEEHETIRQLERLLTETFVLVIVFAREATQYYGSRTRRLKDTLVPERIKSATLIQIRGHLEKVRDQCDTLMLTHISSLQRKVDDMRLQLDLITTEVVRTRLDVRHSNTAASQSHESRLRKMLGVDAKSGNTGSSALASLETLIHESFSRLQSATEHPKPTSMALLQTNAEFSRWWGSQTSCLLVAGGVNWLEESSTGSLNWLSLAALKVIQELQGQHKNVAHYLVQPKFVVSKSNRRSLRDVMANLIFQIALMREDHLRSELDGLEAIVKGAAWNNNDTDDFMDAIHDLLPSILSAFPPDSQLWIIIDRLDKCSWSDEYELKDIDFQTALDRLLQVLSEATCCIKVFLVVDAPCARKLHPERSGLPLSRRQKRCLILKSEWRQETEIGRC